MRKAFTGCLCALLCAIVNARAEVALESVEPAQIFVGESAELTLTGDGIEPGAWLAVLDGGPFVAGTLDFRAQVPGAMARIDERFVAVATDQALHVVDLSDPASPASVGRFSFRTSPISAASNGRLVAVGDSRQNGVLIYDVRDRTAPVPAGLVRTRIAPTTLALEGDLLHVGSGREWRFWCLDGAFETFSLADPANPVTLVSMELPGCVRAMADGGGSTLHLLTQDDDDPQMELVTLDVSEPGAPAELSRLGWTNGSAYDWAGLSVDDGIGYVVQEYPPTLRTVDLRDPSAPATLFEGPAPVELFRQTAATDGMLLVGSDGVRLFDVRDPSAPRMQGREQAFSLGGLEVTGDLALAVGYLWENPLSVVDVAVPVRPAAEIVHEGVPGGFQYRFRGTTAFAADLYTGVHVLDLTDPEEPSLIDTIIGPRTVGGIALEGDTLFVADTWYDEVHAYNVGDPTAVETLGVLSTGTVREITAISGYVFATDNRNDGVRVIDFRDPSAPSESGFVPLGPGRPRRIERSVDGSRVYVISVLSRFQGDIGWLYVLDVSDPERPRVEGSLDWFGDPSNMAADDGLLWIADEELGVLRIDVSDPARPASELVLSIPNALGVDRLGRWLAVSSGSLGSIRTELRVYDVTDAGGPRLHQQHLMDRTAFRLHSFGDDLLLDRDELGVIPVPAPPSEPRPDGPRTWTTTLPPGRPAGPYDVLVRNSDGSMSRLRNGLRICERRDVALALEPVVEPFRPVLLPVRWRLSASASGVTADRAIVALPAIDPAVMPAFVAATGPDTIQVRTFDDGRPAGVVLRGRDEARLIARWQAAVEAGGPALPSSGGNRFGDVLLDPRRLPLDGTLHRFVLRDDGTLDAAFASGSAPELRFEASVVDDIDCRFTGDTTLARAIEDLCERIGASALCVGPPGAAVSPPAPPVAPPGSPVAAPRSTGPMTVHR